MSITVINKEETGRSRYVAIDIEVVDGDKVHQISTVATENYDNNSDSYDLCFDSFTWETEIPENWEEIEKKVTDYLESVKGDL